jgi:glycosyltransferase involved in cell wall biosynthesis
VILVAEGEATSILNESQAGIAIPPGKVDDIAQALRQLTLDSELRQELGKKGRIAVKKRFDRQEIVSNFLHFLEKQLC